MTRLVVVLACLLAIVTVAAGLEVRHVRAEARAAAYRADSTAAVNDTLRVVAVRLDSGRTAAVQRALQVEAQNDALDRAVGGLRVSLDALGLQVASLRTTARSTDTVRTDSAGTRSGVFDVRQPPYTVHAVATLPRTGAGSLALGVTLDPLHLGVRAYCGPPDALGVRPASVSLDAPPWARVSVDSLRQDPSVCQSAAPAPRRSWRPRLALVAGIGWPVDSLPHASVHTLRGFIGAGLAIPVLGH